MNKCDRCNRATEIPYIFYEVDRQDQRHKFGTFCCECTFELVDDLKGKVEWFQIENLWRGFILPRARRNLEQSGVIHAKHDIRLIEIVGNKDKKVGEREVSRMEYACGLISRKEYEKRLKTVGEKP